MDKTKNRVLWFVVASESIHIFCCVFPTIFSVMSLLAGAGMIAAMPLFIDGAHDVMHDYEIPMMVVSALILALGWVFYGYSRRISCRSEGTCSHAPCSPKKDRSRLFLIAATLLFMTNVIVYYAFHLDQDMYAVHYLTHG
jgi:hypothetical protein